LNIHSITAHFFIILLQNYPFKSSQFLQGKEGRALDVENLTRMAAFVDQAIEAYKKFQ
jgi:hypothetical protein